MHKKNLIKVVGIVLIGAIWLNYYFKTKTVAKNEILDEIYDEISELNDQVRCKKKIFWTKEEFILRKYSGEILFSSIESPLAYRISQVFSEDNLSIAKIYLKNEFSRELEFALSMNQENGNCLVNSIFFN